MHNNYECAYIYNHVIIRVHNWFPLKARAKRNGSTNVIIKNSKHPHN